MSKRKTSTHKKKTAHSTKSKSAGAAHHKASPKKKEKSNTAMYAIAAAAIVVVVAVIILGKGGDQGGTGPATGDTSSFSGDTVKVDFYVMSQCPYGTQVEDAIAPVLEEFGDAIEFNLNFIASEGAAGQFSSLHGEPEVQGNIAQLCGYKYNPDKYMDMVVCMNKDASSIPGNWEKCAKDEGLDVGKIRVCYEGEEGKDLLRESIVKTNAVGATGSPTMYFNDQPYQGRRDTLAFATAICNYIGGDHEACADLPTCATDADCVHHEGQVVWCKNPNTDDAECVYEDPMEFEIIVLNDKTCTSCATTGITTTTENIFLGGKHRYVDVSSSEGEKLVEDLGITVVPVYLFENKVKDTKEWEINPTIAGAFEEAGTKYIKLLDSVTEASHFVDAEKRKEQFEKIGVTLGDNKPQIDFFVMSYCPYGNQAEEGIEPVFQLLEGQADFNPHYVIYSNYQGGGPAYCIDDESKYCSMHGVVELNQNIRELCVNKYMGTDKWFEFALAMNSDCTSKNADTCWEPVADRLGLDTAKIKLCYDTEKFDMSEEELRLNKLLGVSGSPSVFIDGQKFSGGRTPEAYKQGLCGAFDNAPGDCNTKLEGETATAAPAAGACG
ncbi:MAG: hypothetical protein ABIC95_01445 [archaeon]